MQRFTAFFVFIFLVTASGVAYGGRQDSANYIIEQDVLSCGGGEMASAGYRLLSTLGQPGTIGASASAGYKNHGGYWHPLKIVVRARALPWLFLLLDD
jgi:hypothetical protein